MKVKNMNDAFELTPRDWKDWALFLDIDGTLLELAPTPDAVLVPSTLPAVLNGLSRRLSGALALISGRELAAIERLFPEMRDVAGAHGAQWRLNGRVMDGVEGWPRSLADEVAARAAAIAGVLVERKVCSLSLHYRDNLPLADTIHALAEDVVRRSPHPLRLLHGKAVVELIPDAAGKGRAIERFMEEPAYRGRIPVFVGDDVTDEEGFASVNRLGGISIHVGGGRPTAARFHLSDPETVRRWLARLNDLPRGA